MALPKSSPVSASRVLVFHSSMAVPPRPLCIGPYCTAIDTLRNYLCSHRILAYGPRVLEKKLLSGNRTFQEEWVTASQVIIETG
jgi:hypothetical protein